MKTMSGMLLKRDDGRPYGFVFSGVRFNRLCRDIAEVSGVTFTERKRFFWSSENLRATFVYNGHEYKVQSDAWDDGIWVLPNNDEATYPEVSKLFENVGMRDLPESNHE